MCDNVALQKSDNSSSPSDRQEIVSSKPPPGNQDSSTPPISSTSARPEIRSAQQLSENRMPSPIPESSSSIPPSPPPPMTSSPSSPVSAQVMSPLPLAAPTSESTPALHNMSHFATRHDNVISPTPIRPVSAPLRHSSPVNGTASAQQLVAALPTPQRIAEGDTPSVQPPPPSLSLPPPLPPQPQPPSQPRPTITRPSSSRPYAEPTKCSQHQTIPALHMEHAICGRVGGGNATRRRPLSAGPTYRPQPPPPPPPMSGMPRRRPTAKRKRPQTSTMPPRPVWRPACLHVITSLLWPFADQSRGKSLRKAPIWGCSGYRVMRHVISGAIHTPIWLRLGRSPDDAYSQFVTPPPSLTLTSALAATSPPRQAAPPPSSLAVPGARAILTPGALRATGHSPPRARPRSAAPQHSSYPRQSVRPQSAMAGGNGHNPRRLACDGAPAVCLEGVGDGRSAGPRELSGADYVGAEDEAMAPGLLLEELSQRNEEAGRPDKRLFHPW